MDVREKLVELLANASHECDDFYDLWDMRQVADDIADFLIANGVTVQEWISVKERLPDRFVYVLVMTDFGESAVARLKGNGRWYIGWDNDQYAGITHWMPLPQPPKGE